MFYVGNFILKRISNIDIDNYNQEAIDNFCIYPKIYDDLKMSPQEGDILIGKTKENFDYNEDCFLILRNNILHYK